MIKIKQISTLMERLRYRSTMSINNVFWVKNFTFLNIIVSTRWISWDYMQMAKSMSMVSEIFYKTLLLYGFEMILLCLIPVFFCIHLEPLIRTCILFIYLSMHLFISWMKIIEINISMNMKERELGEPLSEMNNFVLYEWLICIC